MRKIISAILISILVLPAFANTRFLEQKVISEKKIIKLQISSAQIVMAEEEIDRVAIVDPFIVDAKILEPTQMLVRAKQIGRTDMLIWEKGKALPSEYHLIVTPNLGNLGYELKLIDPRIEYQYVATSISSITDVSVSRDNVPGTANQARFAGAPGGGATDLDVGRIVLSGKVKNADQVAQAVTLAGAYVGDNGLEILTRKGGQINSGEDGGLGAGGGGAGGGAAGGGGGGGGTGGGGLGVSFGINNSFNYANKINNLHRGDIVVSNDKKVISYIEVDRDAQIEIAIRFFEISKTFNKRLSVSGSYEASPGSIALFSRLLRGQTPSVSNTLDFNDLRVFVDYLEERGEAKVLAEPTLMVTSGEPASFLAGGETPIVTSIATGAQAQQSISFEPFGIKLSVLPTLLEGNRIHLHVIPEIRNIDNTLTEFVTTDDAAGGIRPPAFSTRKTETQVEMEVGKSLVLSGLLSTNMNQTFSKTPGLGSIPILGELFKSKSFQKGESELFVTITPRIIMKNGNYQDSKAIARLEDQAADLYDRGHIGRELSVDKSILLLTPPDTRKEKRPRENYEQSVGVHDDEIDYLRTKSDAGVLDDINGRISAELIDEAIAKENVDILDIAISDLNYDQKRAEAAVATPSLNGYEADEAHNPYVPSELKFNGPPAYYEQDFLSAPTRSRDSIIRQLNNLNIKSKR